MIVLVTPSDPFVETPTGCPPHASLLAALRQRARQPADGGGGLGESTTHLPLRRWTTGRSRDSHWREDISHPQLDDYWGPLRYQDQFDRVNVPVLHISGWYDDEQIGTPLNFIGMTRTPRPPRRAPATAAMGPWGQINTTRSWARWTSARRR